MTAKPSDTPQPSTASLSRQALIEQTLAEHWDCITNCDIKAVGVVGHQMTYTVTWTCGTTEPYDSEDWIWDAHRAHVAAVLAALDAPQGGDEARLTEDERAALCNVYEFGCLSNGSLYAAVERILADRLAAPRDQADDTLAERVRATTRVEWAVQKRSYPLGQGIRLYGDDEASAREAAPKVIGEGAYPICRTVTEFEPLFGDWDTADQPDATASDSLVERLRAQREWSTETFGPGDRYRAILDHLHKELLEVRREPRDVEEWIDVAILAFDGAWRTGATPEQVVAALDAKYAKNRARSWPDWRTADPDKAIEHVPDATASEEDQR